MKKVQNFLHYAHIKTTECFCLTIFATFYVVRLGIILCVIVQFVSDLCILNAIPL